MKAAEIAFIRNGCMGAADFAFEWRAVALQFERHFLPAWRGFLPVPEVADWTIAGYAEASQLIPGTHFPIICVQDTGDGAVLGDHTGLKALWQAFGRAKPDSGVFSHEALEMGGDPFVNEWAPIPGSDNLQALEVCDAVEDLSYTIEVEIAGDRRVVVVSDFVLPSYFGLGSGMPPFDWLGRLESRGDLAGYRIIRRPDGSLSNEFSAAMTVEGRQRIERKLSDPLSRSSRRIVGDVKHP